MQKRKNTSTVIRKVTVTNKIDDGIDLEASRPSEDAYGDIVGDETQPDLGWDLDTVYKQNPIFLWSHNSQIPIGRAGNIRVEDGVLKAKLHFAPAGTSQKIDELRALCSAGILRGISVGFRPTRSKPRANGGTHYLRQTLVEISLCATPALPSALLQAKALGVSNETLKLFFKQGREASVSERVERSRASVARARALLAKEPKKPKLLTMATETRERYARARAATAKAKAVLAGSDQRAVVDLQRDALEKVGTWRGESISVTWRGQKIPVMLDLPKKWK